MQRAGGSWLQAEGGPAQSPEAFRPCSGISRAAVRLLASWSQPGGSIYIMEIGKHSQLGYQDSKLPPHQKKKSMQAVHFALFGEQLANTESV